MLSPFQREQPAQERWGRRSSWIGLEHEHEQKAVVGAKVLHRRLQHPRFVKDIGFDRSFGQSVPGRDVWLEVRGILDYHDLQGSSPGPARPALLVCRARLLMVPEACRGGNVGKRSHGSL